MVNIQISYLQARIAWPINNKEFTEKKQVKLTQGVALRHRNFSFYRKMWTQESQEKDLLKENTNTMMLLTFHLNFTDICFYNMLTCLSNKKTKTDGC